MCLNEIKFISPQSLAQSRFMRVPPTSRRFGGRERVCLLETTTEESEDAALENHVKMNSAGWFG